MSTTVDTPSVRTWKQNIATWVAKSAHLDTSTQLKPHESFAPQALVQHHEVPPISSGLRTLLLATPPAWAQRDDLPCIGQDDRVGEPYDVTDARNVRKRGLCNGCPVRANCLEDAMVDERGLYSKGSRHMVRGGLTPGERVSLDKTIRDRTRFNAQQEGAA